MRFIAKHIIVISVIMLITSVANAQNKRNRGDAKIMRHKNNTSLKKRNAAKIESTNKLAIKKETTWSLGDLFRNEQKQRELKCPGKVKRKEHVRDVKYVVRESIDDYSGTPDVQLMTHTEEIHFDIIKINHKKLEIPAFKQFKNNMTDFTADGEAEFSDIIRKIRDYLGSNTKGEGVTLKIIGSASQIPTSFDPEKPNNNIRADGSSIPGQTSIENNKLLAMARATELANKIKLIFSDIDIILPSNVNDIELGKTPWDRHAQHKLNRAVASGNKEAIARVYAPFQKEQFVKVESEETSSRTVKPKSVKMYTISMTPKIYFRDSELHEFVHDKFVVSKATYDKIGGMRSFNSVDERMNFLKSLDLRLFYQKNDNKIRWYLVNSDEEKLLQIEEDYTRIYELYLGGLTDRRDKTVLREIITEKYLSLVAKWD